MLGSEARRGCRRPSDLARGPTRQGTYYLRPGIFVKCSWLYFHVHISHRSHKGANWRSLDALLTLFSSNICIFFLKMWSHFEEVAQTFELNKVRDTSKIANLHLYYHKPDLIVPNYEVNHFSCGTHQQWSKQIYKNENSVDKSNNAHSWDSTQPISRLALACRTCPK